MSCRITKGTGLYTIPCTSMTLCAVFHQLQSMLYANLSKLVIVGNTTIEVYNHHTLCLGSYCLLYLIYINFKILPSRLN